MALRFTDWSKLIPDSQWQIYQTVLDEASNQGIDFALGGAFAVATVTGSWRNTKDLDLYVLPKDRQAMIGILSRCGLADYFDEKPYDRWWIYRGRRGDCIVDVIWAMANHRGQIDELWLSGPTIEVRNRRVKVLPVEAMLWDKLYIMQRDRCDWPDVLNLLYSSAEQVEWNVLLRRMGDDAALLAAALLVFRWIAPGRAQTIPESVWLHLNLPPVSSDPLPEIDRRRVSLLDTRRWFGPDRQNLEPAA